MTSLDIEGLRLPSDPDNLFLCDLIFFCFNEFDDALMVCVQ